MIVAATDTHAFLWYLTGHSDRLGAKALRVFQGVDAADGSAFLLVPTMVLCECLGLIQVGRVSLPGNMRFDHWVRDLMRKEFVRLVPLEPEIVLRMHELTNIPDPFDKIIVASAIFSDAPLMTNDDDILRANCVSILWRE